MDTRHHILQLLAHCEKKYPDAFQKEPFWRDNLQMLRSIDPNFRSGAQDGEFLISIVDEAHSLINPEHIEGRGQFGFTTALGPQAYHIIRCSLVTLFLLDSQQGFRDRENTTYKDIKRWSDELGVEVYDEISIAGSQFRCGGSKEYVDKIDLLFGFANDEFKKKREPNIVSFFYEIEEEPISKVAEPKRDYRSRPQQFHPFDLRFFDTPLKLEKSLREKLNDSYSVRIVSSYAREWKTKDVALLHNLPPEMMDFAESYIEGGTTQTWSKIWELRSKR